MLISMVPRSKYSVFHLSDKLWFLQRNCVCFLGFVVLDYFLYSLLPSTAPSFCLFLNAIKTDCQDNSSPICNAPPLHYKARTRLSHNLLHFGLYVENTQEFVPKISAVFGLTQASVRIFSETVKVRVLNMFIYEFYFLFIHFSRHLNGNNNDFYVL